MQLFILYCNVVVADAVQANIVAADVVAASAVVGASPVVETGVVNEEFKSSRKKLHRFFLFYVSLGDGDSEAADQPEEELQAGGETHEGGQGLPPLPGAFR